MPDVIKYENEHKQSTKGGQKRRGLHLSARVEDDEEDEESDLKPRDRKRRKFANHDDSGGGKGEGLGRSSTGDSDVPPSRFVTTTKPIKRPADDNKRTGGGRKRIRMKRFVSEHQ